MIYPRRRYTIIILEPALEFLRGLDDRLRAKALRAVELLGIFGPQLPMPHSRRLVGYALLELRVRQGSSICRLFYFHRGGGSYVVVCGYSKKKDRTDKREIARAVRLKEQFTGGFRDEVSSL